jgi:hypothetical protein
MESEPRNWYAYLAKRRREEWKDAKPPTREDFPGHSVIAEADDRRKKLARYLRARAKLQALANNPNGRVPLPARPNGADSGTSDQPKREDKSLTRSRKAGPGRPKLTDEQRRESKKRRTEKQRELMRRRRAEAQAQRRMPLFDEEDDDGD